MDFHSPFSFLPYCDRRERTHNRLKSDYSRGDHGRKRTDTSGTIYKRDLLGHYGCVNAIEFSSDGRLIASGGDDRRLLIWNLWRTILEDKAPLSINTPHISNVNSCCFDNTDKKVITGGNDGQVIVHDIEALKSTSVYGLSDAVYCISPDPINSTILATASDEGKVQIIDTRTSDDSFPVTLADTGGSMHSVMYNSAEPRIIATANSKLGVALWDIRMPLKCLNYKSNIHNCMSVRFNTRGDKLFALRRRAPPVLYDIAQTQPIYQFDHDTYYNACTLKGGSFAGAKDEFVVSGSDDFCVYLWKIPDSPNAAFTQTEPHAILKGHRSIVNQVRFCPHNQMIITSGVEKLIKVWSPYPTPDHNVNATKYSRICRNSGDTERNAYSHEEYIHMVLRAGSFLSHDYTNGNTAEEPCMIAFFDSLIQREVEQSLSESDKLSQSSGDSSSGEGQGGERLMDQSDSSLIFGMEEDDERSRSSSIHEERRSSLGSERERSSTTSRADRLPYMEYETSSDSGSEVDEILSAMYNRYMHSREQSENQGPTGKKISSVIAQGKYKDKNKSKSHVCKQRLQHIGENLQHSDDQYLRDNARNLSILADVIDNFVDNLVASDSSTSRSISNTNTSSAVGTTTTSTVINSTPSPSSRIMQTLPPVNYLPGSSHHQGFSSNGTTSQTNVSNSALGPASNILPESNNKPSDLQPGRYFIPELEAFAPQSLQAALNQEQSDRNDAVIVRPASSPLAGRFANSVSSSSSPSSSSCSGRSMGGGSNSISSSSSRMQLLGNGSCSATNTRNKTSTNGFDATSSRSKTSTNGSAATSSRSKTSPNGSAATSSRSKTSTNGSAATSSRSKSSTNGSAATSSRNKTSTNGSAATSSRKKSTNGTVPKNGACCSCSSSDENTSSPSDNERSALNLLVQSADVIKFGFNFPTKKMSSKKQTKTNSTLTKGKSSSKHSSSAKSSSSTSTTRVNSAVQSHISVRSPPPVSPTLRLSKSREDSELQSQGFSIKSASAFSSGCSEDSKLPATFKKIKSKKRRFRIRKVGDSSSSSEDDT